MDKPDDYFEAARSIVLGNFEEAQYRLNKILEGTNKSEDYCGVLLNDLGVCSWYLDDKKRAKEYFQKSLEINPSFVPAKDNLALLDNQTVLDKKVFVTENLVHSTEVEDSEFKVAVISSLFNWPSQAGGIVHTLELIQNLRKAHLDAHHFYIKSQELGVGNLGGPLPYQNTQIDITGSTNPLNELLSKLNAEVTKYSPDIVIIIDTWNLRPWIAKAIGEFPYIFRQQALECICPLNNLRFLFDESLEATHMQCSGNQFEDRAQCLECLSKNSSFSGPLHHLERELSQVDSKEYEQLLNWTYKNAACVFTLNPNTKSLLDKYCKRVEVVTWGMEPKRFPSVRKERQNDKKRLLFAGIVNEAIKGFHILFEACAQIYELRDDFELIVTAQPPGPPAPFCKFVGWKSQVELPTLIASSDILIMPTIAQEGLARTTVEAMACGVPTIASDIGGIPHTVTHNETGLLFPPGNVTQLVECISLLLDNDALRIKLGENGRKDFEKRFKWKTVISEFYLPIFRSIIKSVEG